MFFILSKILLFLINPLVWIFALLLWSLLTKNSLRKKRLLLVTIGAFYFLSNSFITDEFLRFYEERNQTYSELNNNYDVAIVLGGFSSYDPTQKMVSFHTATDRLMAGIKLYKTGRAKKIMIVSGSGSVLKPDEKEALFIKDYLLDIGIPQKDLIIESDSKNTRENAINTADILSKTYPKGKFLLVTSATHMPRAKRCFNKAGLQTTPFSVDHRSGPRVYNPEHLFIPNPESIRSWSHLTKEWVGFITYKLLGYI